MASLDVAAARHVLNRLSFGPRPGEVERLQRVGLDAWLGKQLDPALPENPHLEAMMLSYRDALSPPQELVAQWLGADWMDEAPRSLNRQMQPFFADHLARTAMVKLARHILSHRQLEEVMVDFWANHFNVFARKGMVKLFIGDYVERAIRPHALGRFGDLLLATARHPAMLLYLDNARSNARRGLNENYARELLELHTLGVDGGYTQDDVVAVARILSGWGTGDLQKGKFAYRFNDRAHDRGEKKVLGTHFPAGGGEDEGVRLLALLAAHPSTARHVSRKLCARLVADSPPAGCVEQAARAYLESGGDVRRVIEAVVKHPSFLDPAHYGAKLKTPLELVASSARALEASPDGSLDLGRALQALGEPALQQAIPTGYPEGESEWASSGAMLARMRFATSLAAGKVRGLRLAVDELLPADAGSDELVERGNQLFFAGLATRETLSAVREAISAAKPDKRRPLLIALMVGSPEFQRQ